jgi:PAP2 superfamily protein
MSLSDRLSRLRLVVFGSLGAVGAFGVCLAQINGIGLNTPIVRTTFYCFLGTLSLCGAWGLLLPMEIVYDSVWVQVVLILGWFGLVRRNLRPLWEVSAAVSIAATVALAVFWLAPAIGLWAYYGQAAYGSLPPSAEAAFLADFSALREGRFTALLAGQGLVTIPSFHVVFAVLFAWVFRQERFLYPVAIVLNLAVIAVTFPVGWHYLADLPAGMIWGGGNDHRGPAHSGRAGAISCRPGINAFATSRSPRGGGSS